jgi:hypothetical protein
VAMGGGIEVVGKLAVWIIDWCFPTGSSFVVMTIMSLHYHSQTSFIYGPSALRAVERLSIQLMMSAPVWQGVFEPTDLQAGAPSSLHSTKISGLEFRV